MVRKLIRTVKALPKKTSRKTKDEYDLSNLLLVDTTKFIFQEHELKGNIAAKKFEIIKEYLKARLSWSKTYELWDADAWN